MSRAKRRAEKQVIVKASRATPRWFLWSATSRLVIDTRHAATAEVSPLKRHATHHAQFRKVGLPRDITDTSLPRHARAAPRGGTAERSVARRLQAAARAAAGGAAGVARTAAGPTGVPKPRYDAARPGGSQPHAGLATQVSRATS